MRNFKLIAASILTILVAIVVVQNRDPVATHVLFASFPMPLAILLFITAAAGFAFPANHNQPTLHGAIIRICQL
jgi:uncharacterized integral membrane protein